MKENDIRHQKYLEPIVRMALKDVQLILDPTTPDNHKLHRLDGLRILLEGCVRELDAVVTEENKKNSEGFAAAVARIYENEAKTSIGLTQRIIEHITTEVDEARLNSFLGNDSRMLLPELVLK